MTEVERYRIHQPLVKICSFPKGGVWDRWSNEQKQVLVEVLVRIMVCRELGLTEDRVVMDFLGQGYDRGLRVAYRAYQSQLACDFGHLAGIALLHLLKTELQELAISTLPQVYSEPLRLVPFVPNNLRKFRPGSVGRTNDDRFLRVGLEDLLYVSWSKKPVDLVWLIQQLQEFDCNNLIVYSVYLGMVSKYQFPPRFTDDSPSPSLEEILVPVLEQEVSPIKIEELTLTQKEIDEVIISLPIPCCCRIIFSVLRQIRTFFWV